MTILVLWLFRAVGAFVAFGFGATGLIFLFRHYERIAAEAQRGVVRRRTRADLAVLLGGWARESAANLGVMALGSRGLLPRPRLRRGSWLPTEREVRHGRPVLLVPGYGMRRSSLDVLRRRLERTGRPTLAVDLPGFKDIATMSEALARAVFELKGATGADRIDLVCHSRGGLVARHLLANDGAAHVERVVALGTAVQGTKTAAFAFGPTGPEMLPGSALIRSLAKAPPSGVAWHSVNAEFDGIVLPPGNDETPDAASSVRIPGIGHGGLLFSPAAFAAIHAALRRPEEEDSLETVAERAVDELVRGTAR